MSAQEPAATTTAPPPSADVIPELVTVDAIGDVAGLTIVASGMSDQRPRALLTWEQTSTRPDLSVEAVLSADLTFEALEPVEGQPDTGAVTVYQLSGALRFEQATCWSMEFPCRVARYTDVDLTGLAVVHPDLITIELDWLRFGSASEPELPQLVLESDAATGPWNDVGAAMERAGVVGGPIVVGLRQPVIGFVDRDQLGVATGRLQLSLAAAAALRTSAGAPRPQTPDLATGDR